MTKMHSYKIAKGDTAGKDRITLERVIVVRSFQAVLFIPLPPSFLCQNSSFSTNIQ